MKMLFAPQTQVILGLLILAQGERGHVADKAEDQFVGTWIVQSSEKGPPGSPVGIEASIHEGDTAIFAIVDGKLTYQLLRKGGYKHSVRVCRIDEAKDPKQIDTLINEDNVARCLYRFEKNRLIICAGDIRKHAEIDRPTELKAGRHQELTVYKRKEK